MTAFRQQDCPSPPDGQSTANRVGGQVNRRELLGRAGAALLLLGAPSLAAACGSPPSPGNAGGTGFAGVPIGTKNHPAKLPLYPDNQPIQSGLKPEAGPVQVLDWAAYISPGVLDSFTKKYGVPVELTTASTIDEAMHKVTSGAVHPDAWVPDSTVLLRLVAGKLIQPLNLNYIPNLADVSPPLDNPYYDLGPQYTVPNFIWTTGLGWRNDLLPGFNPAAMPNPWDVFWDMPAIKGKFSLQNATPFNPFEVGFRRIGLTDYTNFTQDDVHRALAELLKLQPLGMTLQLSAFQTLASGRTVLAQTYGADIAAATGYLPNGTPSSALSYWFPPNGDGPVNNDFWCVPRSARNPVLGHMFLNHLLTPESALENFSYTGGYQSPLRSLTFERLAESKVVDPQILKMTYVTQDNAVRGQPDPLQTPDQKMWIDQAFAQLST